MMHSGDTDQKRDVSISRLTNSIYYFIDTCFIMELSGTAQGKNRYRLLAFHESEKKIFVDKYYPTLKGARIGFKRKFNDMAWSDEVSPMWTVLYQPDQDWIDKMLSIVSNLRLMNMGIDGIDIISKTSNIDRDSLISEIKLCLVNVVGIIALEIEVNDDLRKKSFWDELETELPEKFSEKFKIDIDLHKLNPLTLDKIADAIIETGIFHEKEVIAKETEKNTKSTQNNYLLFF